MSDSDDSNCEPIEYTMEWNEFQAQRCNHTRMYSCNAILNDTGGSMPVEMKVAKTCEHSSVVNDDLYVRKRCTDVYEDNESASRDRHPWLTSIIIGLAYFIVVVTFPFSMLICVKIVQEYERAVIFRLGRLIYGGTKGPGIFFILPCIETYTRVDLRTISFDVPPQEILTRDSVAVTVDAVVYYRICNAIVSVANVEDAHHSTRLLAQTTLRNVLGTKNLAEILSERDAISALMQEELESATYPWGIKLERVEIKDCRLPKVLQRIMAAEAEATREARAKEIASEGEKYASFALKEASKILNDSSTAIQLRYLQTLINISNEKTSTIIFPLPIGLIQLLTQSLKKRSN